MDNSLFTTAVMKVQEVIKHVNEGNLADPTPCTEWDIRALTNHLINELAWIAPLLEGKTVADVGTALDGDLIKGDAAASWEQYCRLASGAMLLTEPQAVTHLSYADKTAQAYVNEVAADIVVHGWDLAKALGLEYEIDDKTAAAVLDAMKDIMPMAREGGYIGTQVTAAEDASTTDKLLAAFGRSNDWKA